eukprot:107309-Amphidinium_carterae.1
MTHELIASIQTSTEGARSILTEGRQFYVCVEQQARGFSHAEANAARSNVRSSADLKLRRYREADVVAQQK